MTTLFSIFVFASWGLGLLTWIIYIGHKVGRWELENEGLQADNEQKKLLLAKINSLSSPFQRTLTSDTILTPTKELPEKLRELMKSSPNHPEVEEIESSDQIIGVRFEAENYPPGFGDADEE